MGKRDPRNPKQGGGRPTDPIPTSPSAPQRGQPSALCVVQPHTIPTISQVPLWNSYGAMEGPSFLRYVLMLANTTTAQPLSPSGAGEKSVSLWGSGKRGWISALLTHALHKGDLPGHRALDQEGQP